MTSFCTKITLFTSTFLKPIPFDENPIALYIYDVDEELDIVKYVAMWSIHYSISYNIYNIIYNIYSN